jgi:hypothetical protein
VSSDNENGFAWAFGGDSGMCVFPGKVTSRLSPAKLASGVGGGMCGGILLSSLFGAKNPFS